MHQPLLSSHACQKTFAFTLLPCFVSFANLYLSCVCIQMIWNVLPCNAMPCLREGSLPFSLSLCHSLSLSVVRPYVQHTHTHHVITKAYKSTAIWSVYTRYSHQRRTSSAQGENRIAKRSNRLTSQIHTFYYFSSFTHPKFQVQHIHVICIMKINSNGEERKKAEFC